MAMRESVQDFLATLTQPEQEVILQNAASHLMEFGDGGRLEADLLLRLQNVNKCDECGCFIAKPEGDEFNVCEECFSEEFEDGTHPHG